MSEKIPTAQRKVVFRPGHGYEVIRNAALSPPGSAHILCRIELVSLSINTNTTDAVITVPKSDTARALGPGRYLLKSIAINSVLRQYSALQIPSLSEALKNGRLIAVEPGLPLFAAANYPGPDRNTRLENDPLGKMLVVADEKFDASVLIAFLARFGLPGELNMISDHPVKLPIPVTIHQFRNLMSINSQKFDDIIYFGNAARKAQKLVSMLNTNGICHFLRPPNGSETSQAASEIAINSEIFFTKRARLHIFNSIDPAESMEHAGPQRRIINNTNICLNFTNHIYAVAGLDDFGRTASLLQTRKPALPVLIYPQASNLPLTTIEQMPVDLPKIAPLLSDDLWTSAAETTLLSR